ncbi:hypothetical protein EGR_08265 [Echinococcus granulosus]|uniref:Uncharacterized protein n=1 Tax=Echinococcus granulosus TaxID=6210 RepID=W6UTZ5_ECHGR|nr:hypothetical protein EGR_08265 [Echinococcus granulosus]EUB56859.1 hypothetical protein EGR_08265 [Echinococcus granulosus]
MKKKTIKMKSTHSFYNLHQINIRRNPPAIYKGVGVKYLGISEVINVCIFLTSWYQWLEYHNRTARNTRYYIIQSKSETTEAVFQNIVKGGNYVKMNASPFEIIVLSVSIEGQDDEVKREK